MLGSCCHLVASRGRRATGESMDLAIVREASQVKGLPGQASQNLGGHSKEARGGIALRNNHSYSSVLIIFQRPCLVFFMLSLRPVRAGERSPDVEEPGPQLGGEAI